VNNQMIGKCKMCSQDYCQECSDFEGWEDFCSTQCRDEFKVDEESKKSTKENTDG